MSKFDAVVIGSGTGGLSAALSLATAGKKILLLEQHNMPGGCATSFVRGRFEFDASLHEFCSLGSPGNWAMTGKLLMERFISAEEKTGLIIQHLPVNTYQMGTRSL